MIKDNLVVPAGDAVHFVEVSGTVLGGAGAELGQVALGQCRTAQHPCRFQLAFLLLQTSLININLRKLE